MTITKDADRQDEGAPGRALWRQVVVDFCMRYGNPSTKSKVDALVEQGCTKILFFPLYPQYAGATSATACDQFFRALRKDQMAADAHGRAALFRASALYRGARAIGRARLCRDGNTPRCPGGSYHGVPKRYLMEGDPYHCQCQKTTRLLEGAAGLGRHRDRHHLPEPLRPRGMAEALHGGRGRAAGREGKKRIAVIAPAFSADCIETLEEINEEIRESFEEAGGEEFHLHPLPQRRRRAYRCAGGR
jgi:ferrochelatase